MQRFTPILWCLSLGFVSALSAQDFGDGSDGPLTISSDTDLGTVGVGYAQMTASASAGATTLAVSGTSNFSAGDEVLILSVIDRGGDFGAQEFHRIQSVDSATQLTLTAPLAATFTVDIDTSVQVIEVPNVTDLTVQTGGILRAPAFGGHANPVGGVIALRATGTVLVQAGGRIDVSGRGHVGGGPRIEQQNGEQGESPLGDGATISAANGGGGGGGEAAGISGGDGGGGGGYGAAGSPGLNVAGFPGGIGPGAGGAAYGAPEQTRFLLGSGGGSGGGGSIGSTSGVGGAGGGAIFIAAQTITLEGAMHCDGAPGGGGSGLGSGGGGGGSGGGVLLRGDTVSVEPGGTVTARGAAGGVAGSGVSSSGGSSGVGRIRVEYYSAFTDNGTVDPPPSSEQIVLPTAVEEPLRYL
jgi:hypothetical protein